MRLSTIIFLLFLIKKHSCSFCEEEDLYCTLLNTNRTNDCSIRYSPNQACLEPGKVAVSENLKRNYGDVVLQVHPRSRKTHLSSTIYSKVEWKEAEIRLSEYSVRNYCQVFKVKKTGNDVYNLNYDCELNDLLEGPLFLEINSEWDNYLAHKKILFSIPNSVDFSNFASPKRRLIFSYIDFTNIYKLVLKIQPLPAKYEVKHYKVEVFREKETKSLLVDVRIIPAEDKPVLDLEYITHSEEGYYYFAVSIINEQCPEDECFKSLSPKLHIGRKGMPLVIGIVGASFLIPFVLFILYMSYRNRSHGELTEPLQKIVLIYKPSLEKHNEVVASFAKAISGLTGIEVILDPANPDRSKGKTLGKWCNDNLILASYILYINPPMVDESGTELDYATFCFLKEEMRKLESPKKIISVFFPYSKRELPYILEGCLAFELMKDFSDFISVFPSANIKVDYHLHPDFKELRDKIKVASSDNNILKKGLPEIIITVQPEDSEEPHEADVLL